MKITGSQIGPVNPIQTEKVKKTSPAEAPSTTPKADTVELSADVSVIAAGRKVIAKTPDVRQEKVDALRQAIQEGSYRAPADEIAEKILTEGQRQRSAQK